MPKSLLPEQGLVTAEPVGVVNPGGALTHTWDSLAVLGQQITKARAPAVKRKAESAGDASVSRDENGEIKVSFRTELTDYDQYYNQAAEAGYLAEIETDIGKDLMENSTDYLDDPDGFLSWARGYEKEITGKSPARLKAGVRGIAKKETQRIVDGLIQRKQKNDIASQKGAIQSRMEAKENELYALVRQGGTDTEDFKDTFEQIQAMQESLVNNPLFAISEEEAAFNIDRIQSMAEAEAGFAEAINVYQQHGKQAGFEALDEIYNSPDLNLTVDERNTYIRKGRTEIRSLDADARSAMQDGVVSLKMRLKDAQVAAERSGDWTQVIRPEEIRMVSGDMADQIIADLDFAAETYGTLQEISLASPEEMTALLEQERPEGADYAREQQRYDALTQAVGLRQKSLDEDAAGYLMSYDKGLSEQIQAASEAGDPGMMGAAVSRSLQKQEELGVLTPKVLSRGQRDFMVENIMGDPNDENRFDSMQNQILGLQSLYGEHWPRVMQELVQGGLPLEAEAIAVTANDPAVSRETIRALTTGRKEFDKLLDRSAKSDIDSTTIDELQDYFESVSDYGDGTLPTRVLSMAQLLARQYAVDGLDAKPAARKAVKDLINKRYDFRDGYRVPKEFDSRSVSIEAEDRLDNLEASQLSPLGSSLFPTLSVSDRQEQYLEHLKAYGQWRTLPDDSGLYLVDGNGEPVFFEPKGIPYPYDRQQVSIPFDSVEYRKPTGRIQGMPYSENITQTVAPRK